MTVAAEQSQAPATGAIRRTESVMGTVVSFDLRPGTLPSNLAYLALAEARASLHRADGYRLRPHRHRQ